MSAINPNWASGRSSSVEPLTGSSIVSNFPLIRIEVPVGVTLTVPLGFQFLVANTFSLQGNLDNQGEVVIL